MSGEFIYCPECGESLVKVVEEGHPRMKCPSCGFVHYRNPSPAVGVLILDGDRVLLVKRRFEPYKGLWGIPAGFIEYGEDVRETAVRELDEETGLKVELDKLHAVESCFDDPRVNSILVLFAGHAVGGELKAGDDAEDAGYFPLSELPEIAFEAHRRVLGRLREERFPG
ncbi:MAG: NUDIX hydrolase [Candidatus Krumholzibacteria bacterium]|nr:NUDIX hydrolase [Candidatus Krumholzibacteria bacterium]